MRFDLDFDLIGVIFHAFHQIYKLESTVSSVLLGGPYMTKQFLKKVSFQLKVYAKKYFLKIVFCARDGLQQELGGGYEPPPSRKHFNIISKRARVHPKPFPKASPKGEPKG